MQPQHSYLVCATPRSGSTLFCELLRNSGIAGRPEEYFEHLKGTGLPRQAQEYFAPIEETERQAVTDILDLLGHPSLCYDEERLARWQGPAYGDYLARIIEEGTTPNGVFGAKMMWGYFADFLELARQLPELNQLESDVLLRRIFPNPRFIWVTRQDKTRQAISLWKAIQTQNWRQDTAHNGKKGKSPHAPVFHAGALRYLEQRLLEHDDAWQRYFTEHQIRPLVVIYEDLINDLEATMQQTLRYLEIPQPAHLTFKAPGMHRQADGQSEEWMQLFKQAQPDTCADITPYPESQTSRPG